MGYRLVAAVAQADQQLVDIVGILALIKQLARQHAQVEEAITLRQSTIQGLAEARQIAKQSCLQSHQPLAGQQILPSALEWVVIHLAHQAHNPIGAPLLQQPMPHIQMSTARVHAITDRDLQIRQFTSVQSAEKYAT